MAMYVEELMQSRYLEELMLPLMVKLNTERTKLNSLGRSVLLCISKLIKKNGTKKVIVS